MTRLRTLLLATAMISCSSAQPEPKTEVMAEPKVADDLPTWCSGEQKPCVPTRDFATRLCRGQFAGSALFLFQKRSPWQRRWVNVKAGLAAENGEGGPAGSNLTFAEELLVMAIEAPAQGAEGDRKSSTSKKPDPDVLALRWDGTCASVKVSEVATHAPATPKNAFVDWSKLDGSVQRSLLRESDLQRAVTQRDEACHAKTSPECEKAEQSLSASIVTAIRRGAKLAMPEQRP